MLNKNKSKAANNDLNKSVETKPKKTSSIFNKQNSKLNKQDIKIQQEKSQLAKDLNIRISNPYGYYPEDVDPIIIKLQQEVNNLSKENKILRDTVGDLQSKNKSLSTELTSLKLQISVADIPVSLEDNLQGLSQLGNINGNKYTDSITDLTNRLLDDDDDTSTGINLNKPKPKIKLKHKIGGHI